jgi:hypothetical protein
MKETNKSMALKEVEEICEFLRTFANIYIYKTPFYIDLNKVENLQKYSIFVQKHITHRIHGVAQHKDLVNDSLRVIIIILILKTSKIIR